jgi:colicin import membrane protein
VRHDLVAAREEAAAAKEAADAEVARAKEAAAAEIAAAEENIEEAYKRMGEAEKERREAAQTVERSKKRVSAVYNAQQKALVDQVMREREEAHKMAQQEMVEIAEASNDDTVKALVESKAALEASREEVSGMKKRLAQLSAASEEESARLRAELTGAKQATEVAEATLAQAIFLSQQSQEMTAALMAELEAANKASQPATELPRAPSRRASVHTAFDDEWNVLDVVE